MEVGSKDWLEQAVADWNTAKHNLEFGDFYASVLFSQQSAEKALKSRYLFLTKSLPPKIHDLVELCRLVKAPKRLFPKAQKLAVTYFTSRYPGAGPEIPVRYYDQKKAEKHLREAELILQWVQKKTR